MKIVMILFIVSTWLWGAVQVDEKINARREEVLKMTKLQMGKGTNIN